MTGRAHDHGYEHEHSCELTVPYGPYMLKADVAEAIRQNLYIRRNLTACYRLMAAPASPPLLCSIAVRGILEGIVTKGGKAVQLTSSVAEFGRRSSCSAAASFSSRLEMASSSSSVLMASASSVCTTSDGLCKVRVVETVVM